MCLSLGVPRRYGTHAARLGERQGLAVVGLAALGVEPVRMRGDVSLSPLSAKSGLMHRSETASLFDHLVDTAEQWEAMAGRTPIFKKSLT